MMTSTLIKFKGILLVLLITLFLTDSTRANIVQPDGDVFPSIHVSLDMVSMDKVIKRALPLYFYYGVKNQSFSFNQSFNWHGLLKASLDGVHVNEAKVKNE